VAELRASPAGYRIGHALFIVLASPLSAYSFLAVVLSVSAGGRAVALGWWLLYGTGAGGWPVLQVATFAVEYAGAAAFCFFKDKARITEKHEHEN
jgi:hypothetical protein